MRLYSAIDLHSTNSYIAVLDQDLSVVRQRKLSNDLDAILAFFEPYRNELEGIAVESTFDWYWLVDGLMDAGYRAHLVNPGAVKRYDGLKYTDDRHDARWPAHRLALGILPEGYIYPQEDRPLRDLLRRRAFLVRKRTSLLLAERNIYERTLETKKHQAAQRRRRMVKLYDPGKESWNENHPGKRGSIHLTEVF